MLIKFGGGSGGFIIYMIYGRKVGRLEDRDQLDKRVVLCGDIAELGRILDGMEDRYTVVDKETGKTKLAEKYIHFTCSFAEHEVSEDILRNLMADIKQFATAGYRDPDEIYIYAEAHLPRIKQTIDANGEAHDRLVHIHCAIPLRNMVTGSREEVFGLHGNLNRYENGRVEAGDDSLRVKWVDAFQEFSNLKYGFKSPKDSPRQVGGKGQILERHKGDEFPKSASAKEVKAWAAALAETTYDYATFKEQLERNGEVRLRNSGSENEYLWFKPAGAKEGMNLREQGFRPGYFEKPVGERPALSGKQEKGYVSVAGPSKSNEEKMAKYAKTLEDWHRYGATEMRFAGSHQRRSRYGIGKDTTESEKIAIVKDRETRFYKKHAEKFNLLENENVRRLGSARIDFDGRGRGGRSIADLDGAAAAAVASRSRDRRGIGGIGEPANQPVQHLREQGVAAGQGADHLVLPGHVHGDPSVGTDAALHSMGGRKGIGAGEAEEIIALESSSEIGQMVRDLDEKLKQQSATSLVTEIKKNLQPERLLASLVSSHQLNTKLYQVSGQNIVAGPRTLTVNDFLTKEMHLSWPEAEAVLKANWEQQQRNEPFEAPEQAEFTDKQLWSGFQAWKTEKIAVSKREFRAIQDKKAAALADVRRQGRAERKEIRDNSGKGVEAQLERTRAISNQRMTQVFAEAEIMQRATAEREAAYQNQPSFRGFLHERANQGDAIALDRLRRMAPDKEPVGNRAAGKPLADAPSMSITNLKSVVDRNGTVVYYDKAGEIILADAKNSVVTKTEREDVLRLQLNFSIKKFGNEDLKLAGTDTFLNSVIRMAASDKQYSKLSFADKDHQALLEKYRGEAVKPIEKPETKAKDPVAQGNQEAQQKDPLAAFQIDKKETLAALDPKQPEREEIETEQRKQTEEKAPPSEQQVPPPAAEPEQPPTAQFDVHAGQEKQAESMKIEETPKNDARMDQAKTEIKAQQDEPPAQISELDLRKLFL